MINDANPHRVSACPVHFIWDGRGKGRIFVRLGFMGFALGGMIGTGASLMHLQGTAPVLWAVLGVSGASWALGQVLSLQVKRSLQAKG